MSTVIEWLVPRSDDAKARSETYRGDLQLLRASSPALVSTSMFDGYSPCECQALGAFLTSTMRFEDEELPGHRDEMGCSSKLTNPDEAH